MLQMIGLGAASAGFLADPRVSFAAEPDQVTIGWPSDIPSWDPNERTVPDAQPIYKLVFDQPLDQAPDFSVIPNLVAKWEQSKDAKTLSLVFRDDIVFHDGSKMTSEDFAYSFHGRVVEGHKIDIAQLWPQIVSIDTPSPTEAIMHFSNASATAVPWLAFLCSYVVPKAYMEKVGVDGFKAKPIGSGPYKLVEYQLNSRIVLERNEAYFGAKPAIKRVIFQIIGDPAARVAALESSQIDIALNIPMREVKRLDATPNFSAEINPISRIITVFMRGDLGMKEKNIRLAAHHAIDKVALSKAFYLGAAVPLSVFATPGTPGYIDDYSFSYDPAKSKALLAEIGYSVEKPAKITFGSHNGQFPGDYDIARAIVQMWKKVGIEAELEVIEYAKYFELNHANKLPDAMLYSWDNATGDPEIFIGYALNPVLPFGSWKEKEIGSETMPLFGEPDPVKRLAAYKDLEKRATEYGAIAPLLQSVLTVGHKKTLHYKKYGNGWVLANTMTFS
jgi:peptide/nickel transport system substrate-binding protein